MKLFTGSLAAGLVLLAAGAQAQVPYGNGRSPYAAASDFDAPYAAVPPAIPGPRYGYGPSLLPSTEVYAVLRDNGFSPLGIPRLRGFVYTIAVLDRGGEDGRLIIDARNGRIIRFMPAYRMGDQFNEESRVIDGSPGAPAAGPCEWFAAAAAARPKGREPHGAGPEGQPARRQTRRSRTGQASGGARAKTGRGSGGRPAGRDDRFRAGEARSADCAD